MLDLWKTTTTSQFESALSTLSNCIDACPDAAWDAPIANMAFCQVVFHTLFFADCYLSPDNEAMLAQPFHKAHPEYFRDYEEMIDRRQEYLYDRPTTRAYVEHCRAKAAETIAAETEATLRAPAGFPWLPFTRAEVYPYQIRHIQHHAAQLSLRLRLDQGVEIPWSKVGWREMASPSSSS